MKPFYLAVLLSTFFASAQTITFPNANFKARLLMSSPTSNIAKNAAGVNIKIDVNNDSEIQISEAAMVAQLNVNYSSFLQIASLEGILNFVNLTTLSCTNNAITQLDLHGLSGLTTLNIQGNPLTHIDLHDCTSLPGFSYYGNNVVQHINLSGCTSMQVINCSANWSMQTFNISGCTSATSVNCGSAIIDEIDLTALSNCTFLNISGIGATTLDFSNMVSLEVLRMPWVPVTSLDLSVCSNLQQVICYYMMELQYLNIKNGSQETLEFAMEDPVQYICADEADLPYMTSLLANYNMASTCNSNPYCTFEPGGQLYTVNGTSTLDQNGDGCTVSDYIFPEMLFSITDGTSNGHAIGGFNGAFTYPLTEGTHTITPEFENPQYFSATPDTIEVTFPGSASPFTQNFCITPIGVHPDLEIVILPLAPLRPGATVPYKLIYRNVGNQVLSGNIHFSFDQTLIDFVAASPSVSVTSVNDVMWSYSDIFPLETREIEITLHVHTPMGTAPVNAGDMISFTATIDPVASDEHIANNTFLLKQIVVASLDPNDKTCLEGSVVGPEMAGEYVHYIVRFENTGTYYAENIVVKDIIDTSRYDISSLRAISASAPFTYAVDGEKVEFFFANINLPFDDENNDGYIAFKIKTLPTLTVGDSFSNFASIYFDYNFPIITNTAVTTIQTLGTANFSQDNGVVLYPNPVNDVLNIEVNDQIQIRSVKVYNPIGQLVLSTQGNQRSLDVSLLVSGNYLVKVETAGGEKNSRFVKL